MTDLRIDKTKQRGQIRSIKHDNVVEKMAGYLALSPPGQLRVTAWEDSGMTRFAFLHTVPNISSPCYAVIHLLRCKF